MEQNCQILLHLFEDILDVSAIESRSITLNKEDVPLKELLLKIVSKFNTQLTISGTDTVEIIVDEDNNFDSIVMFTDRKRITQIFHELLSNAVKFTNEGHIKICYEIYPENITFYISDTGVGIPDMDNELIFKSFSHGQNMFVTLHKGVGLGLNIATLLVEMMGGKLTYTSKEGKGSTFSFTFPSIDLKNYTLNGNSVIKYNLHLYEKNILIAEDNDESFKYLETILSPANNVTRAKTGIEAVTMTENAEARLDVILMDILMPEMDGIHASQIIRKLNLSIPIIAITAMDLSHSNEEYTIFDAVLAKPITAQLLMDNIHEALEKYSSLRNQVKTKVGNN